MKKAITILALILITSAIIVGGVLSANSDRFACSAEVADNNLMTLEEKSLNKGCILPSDKSLTLPEGIAYLVEYNTNKVLYANRENEKHQIASMVKIMTLLLTFEAIDRGEIALNDTINISHEAAIQTGSELFIDEGVDYKLSDLIKGIVVVSANDACVAVAERLSGSVENFVKLMNEKAKQLGMENTLFANCTGLPSQFEQYSTAKDVNIMMRELLKHKEYYNYSKIWLEDYSHPSGRITQLANTNKLVRHFKGCDSGKTGYTDSAKYCLSASCLRGDMRVVATVIGVANSKERFNAVSKLFNYSFANFKVKTIAKAGAEVGLSLKVVGGKVDFVNPVLSQDLTAVVGSNSGDLKVDYQLFENAKAPLKSGDCVGYATVSDNNGEITKVELILKEDLPKATFWDFVRKLCKW